MDSTVHDVGEFFLIYDSLMAENFTLTGLLYPDSLEYAKVTFRQQDAELPFVINKREVIISDDVFDEVEPILKTLEGL